MLLATIIFAAHFDMNNEEIIRNISQNQISLSENLVEIL